MAAPRDGHVRVLPLHVANKIAAGEVVERPASVVKELVENAIDAGARTIRITVTAGGRKLVAVQDDGCGMTKDDALLSLERQATSKIRDVDDIEAIDTLGFRGEAIPSIASVSRFTLTTRRHESDEGTFLQVNAGTLADVRTAGCPPGTLVEVRDLFCNVPARRKFLRSYATEESHVRTVFTVHALAHPEIGFSLVIDGRELYRLAPSPVLADRVRDIFGADFVGALLTVPRLDGAVSVTGFVERPNLALPTRRDQYVFINGRPATAPSIAYALREAYPRRAGEVRPAAILFLELPPGQVDVNVHPTKREVRFRDNTAVKQALVAALDAAFSTQSAPRLATESEAAPTPPTPPAPMPADRPSRPASEEVRPVPPAAPAPSPSVSTPLPPTPPPAPVPAPQPLQVEFAVDPATPKTKPWKWFRFLAQATSGYLFVETDEGIVTINPVAARERIAFERLFRRSPEAAAPASQQLLIPETVRFSPVDFARIGAALSDIRAMGFQIEEFGALTYKVEAVPQILGTTPPAAILATIAHDLEAGGTRRSGERWREELVAKSIARAFAGSSVQLTPESATRLVEELAACRMPYVCPRGKMVLLFTSTRELDRKFNRS